MRRTGTASNASCRSQKKGCALMGIVSSLIKPVRRRRDLEEQGSEIVLTSPKES